MGCKPRLKLRLLEAQRRGNFLDTGERFLVIQDGHGMAS
jgi:hypothetical protein